MSENPARDLKRSDATWIDGPGLTSGLLTARVVSGVFEYQRPLAFIALSVVLDWIGLAATHLEFTGWSLPMGTAALLVVVGLVYVVLRPSRDLAEAAFYAAFWIVFVQLGCILTYVAARYGARLPLADPAFAALDAALRFDWVSWVREVRSSAVVWLVLRSAYFSLLFQIVGSLLLFALLRVPNRNEEFFTAAAVSLLLTCLVSALAPAAGPWGHFDLGTIKNMSAADLAPAMHVQALRQGEVSRFALGELQGIVSLPSYHTVLALLCVYAHRGLRWSFPPIVLLNCVMLVSVPSEGGHYLVDMIAGGIVALATIAVVHVTARAPERGSDLHRDPGGA